MMMQVFESFEEVSKDIYNKHIFYVVNQDNEVEYRIQTEYSPISVEQGSFKYLLCQTKGDTHSTFNIGFNDNFKYDGLKKSVIDILEGNVRTAASSISQQEFETEMPIMYVMLQKVIEKAYK